MTTERKETENGGYALGIYMDLDNMVEVDKDKATGLIITEYTPNGIFVRETVVRL